MRYDDAILITEDAAVITLNLPANRKNFAEYAAAVLRCKTIEPIDLPIDDGVTAWFDEDGRGTWGSNALFDALASRYGITESFSGPALITGCRGAVCPLRQASADQILRALNDTPA